MKILNITIDYSLKTKDLYNFLCESLVAENHQVTVLSTDSNLKDKAFEFSKKDGVDILRVRTSKLTKVGLIRKAFAFLALPFILKKIAKKQLKNKEFDLILFMAPPVTLVSVVAWAKKYFKAKAFLMQKDIFPQNAVDLKMFSKSSPIYAYFRNEEKKMLNVADWIGCMSEGNIDFLKKHNPKIKADKFIYFPNTIAISPNIQKKDNAFFKEKYKIPKDACVFLYGGNMGIPQYIQLLISAIDYFKNRNDVFFMCVGTGTRSHLVDNFIKENSVKNAIYLPQLPKDEYDNLAVYCDVGLVTLSPLYTIPNYPSKTLSYMDHSMPIIAATDVNTDYQDLISLQAKCGIWCDSAIDTDFFKAIDELVKNKSARLEFGKNARKYLEDNFEVSRSVKILENLSICSK